MMTKYYRFLYYPVAQGTFFGASIGATEGEDGTQILYLSGVAGDGYPSFASERIHYLILADRSEQTIARARKVAETNRVDTVLTPKGAGAQALLPEGLSLCEVEDTMEIALPDFALRLFCSGGHLIAYLGSAGRGPAECECVMSVKSCTPDHECRLAVDAGNLNCEMKCLLRQDVTFCKKQNQRNEEYFVDGHLLSGTADIKNCLPKLKAYLAEEWKKIRFTGLPDGCGEEMWSDALLASGTEGHRRYFIGGADVSPEVVKAVAAHDAYSSFALTGRKAGLCISGCYADR